MRRHKKFRQSAAVGKWDWLLSFHYGNVTDEEACMLHNDRIKNDFNTATCTIIRKFKSREA